MLNDNERKLLQTAWNSGPSALLLAGYTPAQISEFLKREDVQLELTALDREFKHASAFDARVRYSARKSLAQLSPGAVGLLARAMGGPVYARGPVGEILRDARGFPILKEAELTSTQLRAAEIVIDAVGGRDPRGADYRGEVQINVLLSPTEKAVTIEHDAAATSPEQKALSRERMRNAIDRLMLQLPKYQNRVAQALGSAKTIDTEGTTVKPKIVKKKMPKGGSDGSKKAV